MGHTGTLTVIKDLNLKEPYVGSVELLGGEIAEDIASYFVESEQIPTACGLGVLVDRDRSVLRAGGYLIQLLPGAPEGIIDRLEKGIMEAGPVTKLLLDNDDPESLLRRVMSGFELDILETAPVEYRCYCSREDGGGAGEPGPQAADGAGGGPQGDRADLPVLRQPPAVHAGGYSPASGNGPEKKLKKFVV